MAAISKVIRLSQKLIGAEPSISTLDICFVGHIFQKKYCRIHHSIESTILEANLKNDGHIQSNTSISETKRRSAFNVDSSLSICCVGHSFHTSIVEYIMQLYPSCLEVIKK